MILILGFGFIGELATWVVLAPFLGTWTAFLWAPFGGVFAALIVVILAMANGRYARPRRIGDDDQDQSRISGATTSSNPYGRQ